MDSEVYVLDALIEITGNNSSFVLVKLLPLQIDSSMNPAADTKPSTLRVAQLLRSSADLRNNLSLGEPSVLLHSSRMLSQCEISEAERREVCLKR